METYQVISVPIGFSQKKAIAALAKEVNLAIARGWRPVGGLTCAGTWMHQAIYKER